MADGQRQPQQVYVVQQPQPQSVYVQYVDQYGNPVVPVQQQQQPQPVIVVQPNQQIQQQHQPSIANSQHSHAQYARSYQPSIGAVSVSPPPSQISLKVDPQHQQHQQQQQQQQQQQVPGSMNIVQDLQTMTDKRSKEHDEKGVCCPFFQWSQLAISGIWKLRLCGDCCCKGHMESTFCRPKDDCDCVGCLIYLILFCCVWECLWNCICNALCREENKWCCIPFDLLLDLFIFIPLFGIAILCDVMGIFLAIIFLILDPICCLLTCNGEFCRWRLGHNALCCCTLGWYQSQIDTPKDGCWENECGESCGFCYCYQISCDDCHL